MGAILGAIGPLLYYISQPAREYILGNGLFLWPTGLIIIMTYGHEHDFLGYAVTASSVVLNIALYSAAVMLLWFIAWIVRRGSGCETLTVIAHENNGASGNHATVSIRSFD